jgi:imidazolonepropionase-like amidohydrolase
MPWTRFISSILITLVSITCYGADAPADAKDKKLPQLLITNVKVFDGQSPELSKVTQVLIEGNVIKQISPNPTVSEGGPLSKIDGGGRALIPGLIDAHWHTMLAALPMPDLLSTRVGYAHVVATAEAKETLMRGVTTVRDMGGPVFGLKRAIDENIVPGPRIFPSGAFISQTSGHGDLRAENRRSPHFGGSVYNIETDGFFVLADGVAEVQAAVRENLRLHASQIKLAAGGGYASQADPIDSTQYSLDEIKAAVGAAEDWGTYVTVHAYSDRGVNRAIDAGVKVIEHGQLLTEATIKRMSKEGIWLSTQPFTDCHEASLTDTSNAKLAQVCKGTDNMYKLTKKYPKLKVAWGTDMFFSSEMSATQVQWLGRLTKWYSSAEILKMATGSNGELLKLSGLRSPYPKDIGVIKEGAYADLLLVEGNPLEDISVLGKTENLRVIVKDGKIYKNTLDKM